MVLLCISICFSQEKKIGVGYDNQVNAETYLKIISFNIVCSGIDQCKEYLALGYKPEDIRVSIGDEWNNDIDTALAYGITEFFIDEPIRSNKQKVTMAIATFLMTKPEYKQGKITLTLSESEFLPTILFKLGWKGNIGELVHLARSLPFMPQLSCHTHWDSGWWSFKLFDTYFFYCDPRVQFDWLKENFPDNFDRVWIGYDEDKEQKELIFQELNELKVHQILIFPYFDGQLKYDYHGMVDDIELAKQYGWLK